MTNTQSKTLRKERRKIAERVKPPLMAFMISLILMEIGLDIGRVSTAVFVGLGIAQLATGIIYAIIAGLLMVFLSVNAIGVIWTIHKSLVSSDSGSKYKKLDKLRFYKLGLFRTIGIIIGLALHVCFSAPLFFSGLWSPELYTGSYFLDVNASNIVSFSQILSYTLTRHALSKTKSGASEGSENKVAAST